MSKGTPSTLNRRQWLATTGALALAGTGSGHALAQQDTIKFVLGFPPGSALDIIGRVLAPHMSQTLGKTIVIENKPGASGTIATRQIESTAPSAEVYSLLPTTTMMGFVLQGHEPPLDNITAISRIYEQSTVFAINPSSAPMMANVHTLKDLVEVARKNPGAINYSTASPGSISHLTTEKLGNIAGVKFQHVAYKGSQPAIADMLAGHLHMVAVDPTNLSAHMKNPKVRCLALNYAERLPYLPEVPTVSEAGFKELSSVVAWVTLIGPPKMPTEQVRRMANALHKAVNDPAINKRIRDLNAIPRVSTPDEAKAQMAHDLAYWKKVITDNKIQSS